jgi:hypothetical protein
MSGPRAPHPLRHEPQRTPLKFEEPYWHGRIGYVLTARAAMSAAAPPSGRARSAPVADAPPRAFAAMAGAWVQPA